MPTGIYIRTKPSWNKGLKIGELYPYCGFQKGHPSYHTKESKDKISKNNARHWLGKKRVPLSEEHKKMLIEVNKGNKYAWKGGVQKNERNDPAYHIWVKQVKRRDNNTCLLKDFFNDFPCLGYNIIHHIKNWKDYLEKRYELTNGITLCQIHHPRTRIAEKQLEPILSALVGTSA